MINESCAHRSLCPRAAEQILELAPELAAEAAVDEQVDVGVEGHEQVGDLRHCGRAYLKKFETVCSTTETVSSCT